MDQVKPICIVPGCDQPATRVVHGRDYCSRHREGHENPEVPITPCEICGLPTAARIAGRDLCRDHAGRSSDRVA